MPDNQRYGIKSVSECLSRCYKKELVLRFGYSFNAERAFLPFHKACFMRWYSLYCNAEKAFSHHKKGFPVTGLICHYDSVTAQRADCQSYCRVCENCATIVMSSFFFSVISFYSTLF